MWRRVLRQRWYRNLLGWSTAAALIIVAGIAAYTYQAYRIAATELLIERDRQVALLSAARLRTELSEFTDALFDIGRMREISGGDPAAQQAALRSESARLAIFDGGVVLLDSQGFVRAAEPPRPDVLGHNWSTRETFQAILALSGSSISNVIPDGPNGALVIAVGVPLTGEDGEFVGALLGMFRLGESARSPLYASIVRLRLAHQGQAYVIDGRRRILYDTNPANVGHYLRANQQPVQRGITEADALRTVDEDGRSIVAAYAPVPGTSWVLVTIEDWGTLTSSTRRYSYIFLLSLVAGLAIPPLGLGLLGRQRRLQSWYRFDPARDEHLAALFQRELLPKQIPMIPGWDLKLAHNLRTGRRRHFMDAVIRPDGRLALALGHVEEPGIHAALALASIRAVLRAATFQQCTPEEALRVCMGQLSTAFPQSLKMSCVYLVVDPQSGEFEYACVGGAQPLMLGPERRPRTLNFVDLTGLPPDLSLVAGTGHIQHGRGLLLMSESADGALPEIEDHSWFDDAASILNGPYESADVMAEHIRSTYEDHSSLNGGSRKGISFLLLMRSISENGKQDEAT